MPSSKELVPKAVAGVLFGDELALDEIGQQPESRRGGNAYPAGNLTDPQDRAAVAEDVQQLESLQDGGRPLLFASGYVGSGPASEVVLFFQYCCHG